MATQALVPTATTPTHGGGIVTNNASAAKRGTDLRKVMHTMGRILFLSVTAAVLVSLVVYGLYHFVPHKGAEDASQATAGENSESQQGTSSGNGAPWKRFTISKSADVNIPSRSCIDVLPTTLTISFDGTRSNSHSVHIVNNTGKPVIAEIYWYPYSSSFCKNALSGT